LCSPKSSHFLPLELRILARIVSMASYVMDRKHQLNPPGGEPKWGVPIPMTERAELAECRGKWDITLPDYMARELSIKGFEAHTAS